MNSNIKAPVWGAVGLLAIFIAIIFCKTPTALANEMANKIKECYASGHKTVLAMHDCAGGWVTSHILLRCVLNAKCEPFPDTLEGKRLLKVAMAGKPLTTELQSEDRNLPWFPSRVQIANCKRSTKSNDAFIVCIYQPMIDGFYKDTIRCRTERNGNVKAECIGQQAKMAPFIKCVGSKTRDKEKIVECLKQVKALNKSMDVEELKRLSDCARAPNAISRISCLAPKATKDQKTFSKCLAEARSKKSSAEKNVSTNFHPSLRQSEKLQTALKTIIMIRLSVAVNFWAKRVRLC
jgi:hypothetical protein